MSHPVKPILAVTLGDPAGSGPELIAKAFADPDVRAACCPVVVGDASVMRAAAEIVGSTTKTKVIKRASDATDDPTVIAVFDLANMPVTTLARGKVSPACGQAAYEAVVAAVKMVKAGGAHAVVTSALNKQALHDAGHAFEGHTELLAELCGWPPVTMMLVASKLRICHVSTHVSLRQAIDRVTSERILQVLELARDGIREQGIAQPRLAVAGLNPHAGEGGIFGDEESRIIGPAIATARERGFEVSGPWAGDTVFYRAMQGEFDGTVAMYHDQGHVAAKMLGIWQGVNVTLGLPIIRTSVEHGTDFANAGRGTGDPRSLVQAMKLAATMAANRLAISGSALKAKARSR